MTIQNPYWYYLIKTLKDEKEISNGVTIPYLIGAYRLINKNLGNEKDCIYNLLTEISISETELKPVLQNCEDIGQIVIGLKTKDFCKTNFTKELAFLNRAGEKTLFITENAKSLGGSLEEIATNLFTKYKSLLENEFYSWRRSAQVWEKFNSHEIELIQTH